MHSSIPTVPILQRQNNLIDRRRRAADQVIVAMRDESLALRCSHEKSGTRWWLSDGRPVQPEVAKLVTIDANITSVGDGLFRNCRAKRIAAFRQTMEVKMSDEQAKKPDHLKLVPEEELDEEEKEFRALRRDIPGVKGAADIGMLTISVGRQPTPKNTFYRTHPTFRPVVPMVVVEVGMDHHFIAVMPNMIEPLASMGIMVADHTLYLTVTPEGGLRIIPVRCPNAEGEQNEWDRTKEMALIEAMDGWYRMYTDRANNAYKNYPAPAGRYGDPKWPDIKPAKIIKMAFKDKGRLIAGTDHILVQKWAGRDRG